MGTVAHVLYVTNQSAEFDRRVHFPMTGAAVLVLMIAALLSVSTGATGQERPGGVSTAATVPLATVLLAIPATLLAANLIAAAPGWEAARLRPALVLRTE